GEASGAAGGAGWEEGGSGRQIQRSRVEDEAEQSAQVLLPDDLWAILTGEVRRPAPPSPVTVDEEYGEHESATESGAEWVEGAAHWSADDAGFEERTPTYSDRSDRRRDGLDAPAKV